MFAKFVLFYRFVGYMHGNMLSELKELTFEELE